MTGTGRISFLISKELQTLGFAIKQADKEVTAEIRKQTRLVVEPVWKEAVRANVSNRLQTRTLGDTAKAAVSDQNVFLRSASAGKLSSGVPVSQIAFGVEFGANRNTTRTVVSRKGKSYTRHTKRQLMFPRRRGYVVFPAAREVIPRIASLWVATAVRTLHESFEKGGAN